MSEKFKLPLIIWSYMRPAQLDLLLQSVDKFAPDLFEASVLYKAPIYFDEDPFYTGYQRCAELHPNVYFEIEGIEEGSFNRQTKRLLDGHKYFCISTDDSVLCDYIDFKEEYMDGVDCFSFRLSPSSLLQNPFTGEKQAPLTRFVQEENTVVWDTRLYHPHSNFGYNYGMDFVVYSSIYRRLIEDIPFKKTNDIESYLSTHCRDKINPYMRSFLKQKAINLPLNNSSSCTISDESVDFEAVNKRFLNGERFSMKEVEEIIPLGCHQTVKLRMEKY